jgi:hypothetical protein
MQSVYGWSDRPQLSGILFRVNIAGKIISVILPVVMISLLQLNIVQSTLIGYLAIADGLRKYIHAKLYASFADRE